MLLTRTQIRRLVYAHGREILEHDHMAIERVCYQHGVVTTFAHSIRVACLSVWLDEQPYEKVNGQGYDDWYGHGDAVIMHDGIGRIGHRQNDRTR